MMAFRDDEGTQCKCMDMIFGKMGKEDTDEEFSIS